MSTDGYEIEPGALPAEAGRVAAAMLAQPIRDAREDPGLFQWAAYHHRELAAWFAYYTGWPLVLDPAEGMCRLYKQRVDPPGDRPPMVSRSEGKAMATPLALTLLCLVCEQLWRRPQATFNDLQRAVIQSAGTEAATGRLPRFRPVALPHEPQTTASKHRRAFIDALRVLESWRVIRSDGPMDQLEQGGNGDMMLTARRERLAMLPAVLAASTLAVDLDDPGTHVAALTGHQQREMRPDSAGGARRRQVLRAVLDDPGIAPDSGVAGEYLATCSGRDQALRAAASVGLACTVRSDWWMVGDPQGGAGRGTFPLGRAVEHQGALLLIRWLQGRERPLEWFGPSAAEVALQECLDRHRWWARGYQGPGGARKLAVKAVGFLVEAGVVVGDRTAGWLPTAGVHLWRVDVAVAAGCGDTLDEEESRD